VKFSTNNGHKKICCKLCFLCHSWYCSIHISVCTSKKSTFNIKKAFSLLTDLDGPYREVQFCTFLFLACFQQKVGKCSCWICHVCPDIWICLLAMNQEPPNRFSLNFILGNFYLLTHSSFV
jgi:hypothetical protein